METGGHFTKIYGREVKPSTHLRIVPSLGKEEYNNNWVLALPSPMHLGFINRPIVHHTLY